MNKINRTLFKPRLLIGLITLIVSLPIFAQNENTITVPSFEVLVADSTSATGDKPYGMLIDVPDDVELATIVINGIALDLTGGTVILWRNNIIADTNTIGSGGDDFSTNRRPASWSLSVTQGLVKMRVVDPELAAELGNQSIVVTEGAGASFNEDAVGEGEKLFDIKPFEDDQIEDLQAIASAVNQNAELTILTEDQIQVVENSQTLLNSIDNLDDAAIASDIILDNAFGGSGDDFYEYDEVEYDLEGFDDDNLIQFLINSGDFTPAELGELAKGDADIGYLIMDSMLYEENSMESLSALAADNPEMFDFFVDIVEYDERAVDYFLGVSSENEYFVDEWDLYIEEDAEFANAFVGRFNDPAASYALTGLAGESAYINELMLDMAIYDPEFAESIMVDVWSDNPESAQFFFDAVSDDEATLLDAQLLFSENIDAFDAVVDGWASDPSIEFSGFYDEVGSEFLFSEYDINYGFGASVVSCFPLGDGTTDIEISLINIPDNTNQFAIYGNTTIISEYQDYLFLNVNDSDLPIFSIDAIASDNSLADSTVVGGQSCGDGFDEFNGGYDDLYYEDSELSNEFSDQDNGTNEGFLLEILSCDADGFGNTIIGLTAYNLPQSTQDIYLYGQTSVYIVQPQDFITVNVPTSDLPIGFSDAYSTTDYLDFGFVEGLPCEGDNASSSDNNELDEFDELNEEDEFTIEGFGAEVINCSPLDEFNTSVTLLLSNVPETATDMIVYTATSSVSVYPDTTTFLTVANSDLPIGYVEVGNGVEVFDGNSPTGLFCESTSGGGEQGTDSDFDGYTDEVDSCPFEGDMGSGVDEFGCPITATDSDFDGYADEVDSCPFEGDAGNEVDEFGCPITATDSDFDGYTDEVDSCPFEGDVGSGVDEFGCPIVANFSVVIVGCDSLGNGQTTVTFSLSNIPADAAFMLFYHSGGSGVSGGVQSSISLTVDDVKLPFTTVEAERNTSPLLIASVAPSGQCNAP